jgi:NhaA family Na+:H+ antiporter
VEKTKPPAPLPKALLVVIRPFQAFFRTSVAGGIVLLLATVIALALASSRWASTYEAFFAQPLSIRLGARVVDWPLRHWINDALMTVFFFLVGMEIKRELVVGELRTFGRAVLPAIAALGGMIVPAAIYALVNRGGAGARGWGIPMATDIAFALGCVALVGNRVATSLGVFLTALAIFDDLGAIVVIAVFYGHDVSLAALGAAGAIVLVLVAMNRFGARNPLAYAAVGVALWIAVLGSGIHATIAGVILGLCIPARPAKAPKAILADLNRELDTLCTTDENGEEEGAAVAAIERHLEAVQPPLDRIVHALHGWVAFAIVPLFALANAGIALRDVALADVASKVSVGVALGLFFGKQLGIFAFTAVAVRAGISPKPEGATWKQIYGIAVLGGIGFTMSLFVSGLAFGGGDALGEQAKVGILIGSGTSAVVGLALLMLRPAGR